MTKILPFLSLLTLCLFASPSDAAAAKVLKLAKKAVTTVSAVAQKAGVTKEGDSGGSALVGQIIAKVASAGKDSKVAQVVCRKGSCLKVVSIRSGEGAICSVKAIWALATLLCAKVEDFAQSKCAAKHQDANPTEVLRGLIKSKSTPGLDKICTQPTPEVAAACS